VAGGECSGTEHSTGGELAEVIGNQGREGSGVRFCADLSLD
jgi:hypothetical protein